MLFMGIVLVVVLIVAAGAVGAPGSRNSEEAVMEKFCKLECTCCQRRP
jgi:hypothetical protein